MAAGTAEIEHQDVGQDEDVEFLKCSVDCAYFIDTYGVIDDAQGHGDGSGRMPFRLWPDQLRVVWGLMTDLLTVILKARQLGISWLVCGYVLWIMQFQNGSVGIMLSIGEREAKELLRRVRVLYERLPLWLRERNPYAREPNSTEIEWANGSKCLSLPATERAGRSLTAKVLVMDEAAHMMHAEQLFSASSPTIDAGGQLIVLSTANGASGFFHRLYAGAAAGLNGFVAVFLPWWSRPGRDRAWYDRVKSREPFPGHTQQEYPANPTEAFLATGNTRFNPEWVDRQAGNVTESLPPSMWPPSLRHLDALKLYAPPSEGRECIVAADVAEGLEHGDYSSAVVIDSKTWEELADLDGHWEPDEFAAMVHALAEAYGADEVVERNNHGHAVLATLSHLGSRRVATGMDNRPGWLTNVQTKPQTIDALAQALRDGVATIRTAATLGQMKNYARLPNGKTGARPGEHDDRVMKWAIGLGYLTMRGQVASYGEHPLEGQDWN